MRGSGSDDEPTRYEVFIRRLPVHLCVWSSMLLLLCAVAMTFHVRLGLGHWPVPMFENWGSPLFDFHAAVAVSVGFIAVYGAVPTRLLLLVGRRFRASGCGYCLECTIYFGGWLLLWGYCKWDPGDVIAWFLD